MIPNVFIQHAAEILADTDTGLTTSEVVTICTRYAVDFKK